MHMHNHLMWTFGTHAITIRLKQYIHGKNGETAVEAWCQDGIYAILSATIPDAPSLPQGQFQFYLKHWSENAPIAAARLQRVSSQR